MEEQHHMRGKAGGILQCINRRIYWSWPASVTDEQCDDGAFFSLAQENPGATWSKLVSNRSFGQCAQRVYGADISGLVGASGLRSVKARPLMVPGTRRMNLSFRPLSHG